MPQSPGHRTVGDVARETGVTIRTLRYYDDVGVLVPSGRSESGYRLYTDDDVLRLQRVVALRRLGFGVEETRHLVAALDPELRAALLAQRESLLQRLIQEQQLLDALDRALASTDGGHDMTIEDAFRDFRTPEFADEAERRWGDTSEWKESKRRVATYGPEEQRAMMGEAKEINDRLLDLMRSGAAPDSEEARAAAEAHRRHIDRWFYPCSHEMHAGLGQMYLEDERFRAHYDAYGEGFAAFVSAAVCANAAG